jgi:flavoprotein hydroxylase
VLLLADPQLRGRLRAQDAEFLADIGWRVVALAAEPGGGQVNDTTGAYTAWVAGLGAVAVLVRPDPYLYGAAADADDLTDLLAHLRGALRAPAPAT